MKFNPINLVAIAFLSFTIAFTSLNSAMAATVKSNPVDTVKEAAREVTKDTGAKRQFGKSENGERLLDNAGERASQKLDNLAKKANSSQELPDSEQHFMDKVHGKS